MKMGTTGSRRAMMPQAPFGKSAMPAGFAKQIRRGNGGRQAQPQSHSLAMTNTRPGRIPPRGFTNLPRRNLPSRLTSISDQDVPIAAGGAQLGSTSLMLFVRRIFAPFALGAQLCAIGAVTADAVGHAPMTRPSAQMMARTRRAGKTRPSARGAPTAGRGALISLDGKRADKKWTFTCVTNVWLADGRYETALRRVVS